MSARCQDVEVVASTRSGLIARRMWGAKGRWLRLVVVVGRRVHGGRCPAVVPPRLLHGSRTRCALCPRRLASKPKWAGGGTYSLSGPPSSRHDRHRQSGRNTQTVAVPRPSRDTQTEDLRSPTSTGLGRGVAAPFARRRPNRGCALKKRWRFSLRSGASNSTCRLPMLSRMVLVFLNTALKLDRAEREIALR